MEKKEYLLLFVVCLIPFLVYIANSPYIEGADTYYYIDHICHKQGQPWESTYDTLFNPLVEHLPCNFILFKVLNFFAFFILVIFSAKTCEIFYKKMEKHAGLIGGIITATFTFLIFEFLQFQNDEFGYAIGFISLYFLIKYYKQKQPKDLVISLIIIVLAGLVWKGSIYWLLPFAILAPITLVVVLPIIFFKFTEFFWFISGSAQGNDIAYYLPIVGLIFWGLTIFFFYRFPKIDKKIALIIIVLAIPGLFVARLYPLAILFLVIMAVDGIVHLKVDKNMILYSLIFFALMMGFMFGDMASKQFPTTSDINLIKDAIGQVGPSNILQTEFGSGWTIQFFGGIPSSKGSTYGGIGYDYNLKGYVVNHKLDTNGSCRVLETSLSLKLMDCN